MHLAAGWKCCAGRVISSCQIDGTMEENSMDRRTRIVRLSQAVIALLVSVSCYVSLIGAEDKAPKVVPPAPSKKVTGVDPARVMGV